MAVNGDLEDISLFYVVQMLCMEGKTAAMLLKRSGEKGMVFFENGDIVHAVTSSNQVGEEAFCYLLTWEKGSFHIKMDAPITNRSISDSWKRLLMTAVQHLDEEKAELTPPKMQQPLSPEEIKEDYALEQDMVSLLSGFEYVQSRLSGKKSKKNAELAMQLLVGMVNDVITLAEKSLEPGPENTLDGVLKAAGEHYPAMQFLQNDSNRLSVEAVEGCVVLNELRNTGGKGALYQQVLMGLLKVLSIYFNKLIASYNSSYVADQWRETGDFFVRDLSEMIQQIKSP